MVHLTRIYTRTGDDGTTGLSDFSRVSKNDLRLAAYADCDEVNAAIGVAVALGSPPQRLLEVLRHTEYLGLPAPEGESFNMVDLTWSLPQKLKNGFWPIPGRVM